MTTTYTLECYSLTNTEDVKRYQEFLYHFNGFDVFYKVELINTGIESNQEKKYFVLKDKDQVIVLMPFIQRSITINNNMTHYFDVVSPYGYSGPLFTQKINTDLLQNFWVLADKWYRKNNVVAEFIRFNLDGNHINYSGHLLPTLSNVKGLILKDKEQQWTSFIPKVRNNYRKGENNQLTAKIYKGNITLDIINTFHTIYIGTMDRNNADDSYYFSLEYFNEFILKNPTNCALVLIYKENIAISTELILLNKNSMYSFLGGTIADYFSLRPNDFLKIEAMNWGRENNYEYYILGGGRYDFDGLYKYKKTFFPKEKDAIYYTGRKIINNKAYLELCEKLSPVLKESNTKDYLKISEGFFPAYRQ
ncbi:MULTISPECIES: peptidogalycan biosysnthesis protein [unclassified Cellulophaga]|uniref:peptidogalycan biosysnthesis protein n=1 Tax=unclassified Cellulophaga TaxID=2634405 RepID=UPI0026E1314E|nr:MULTISPECIES: peptidogalycan biosysnthesis protein [unclassified Cellulophaga]MDO6491463.1 peptidogalycan biosysnthesis protein [Cellulophaga sp. 2_MG-2023]MDO6493340.1 peptidogalycan biosysnthesis protein [Cellulophaga sp. 3_MG-2023]